jgi:hypothetical protein
MDPCSSFRVKGQALAPDILASIAIMGFMLSIFLMSWNSIVDSQLEDQSERELYHQGERTMKNLLNSPGSPEAWNSDSVEVVGFADRPHVLNNSKIEEFKQLSESDQSSVLMSAGFNLKIEGSYSSHEIGEEPDANQVFSYRRDALLNRSGDLERVEVSYSTWR